MAKIQSTDSLFISASVMGRQFYNFIGSGIDSLGNIIAIIRNTPGTPRGMVTVTVRNVSQGWAQSQSFYNA